MVIKLIIFDFDSTLTNQHIRDYSSQCWHYLCDPNFPALIQSLEGTYHLAICSFNHREIIEHFVRDWFHNDIPFHVMGNGGFSGNKVTMIDEIMEHFGVTERKEVLLFDDDMKNIHTTRKAGIHSILVPGEAGFKIEREWKIAKLLFDL